VSAVSADGNNDMGWVKRNGLSLAMFALFAFSLAGQIVAGHASYNDDLQQHGQTAVAFLQYLGSGHFIEAVFENWESEFLQMGALVLLSAYLYQKGAPDSRKLDGEPDLDVDPRSQVSKDSPWPVSRGGIALRLYEHSLTIALFALFALSLLLHAYGGARVYSLEEAQHGGSAVSMWAYMGTSQFWFESLQNWQSEFLSVGVLAVLSIFLRQRRSPQSKPVADPHAETGG
jgi:hypothetical protein